MWIRFHLSAIAKNSHPFFFFTFKIIFTGVFISYSALNCCPKRKNNKNEKAEYCIAIHFFFFFIFPNSHFSKKTHHQNPDYSKIPFHLRENPVEKAKKILLQLMNRSPHFEFSLAAKIIPGTPLLAHLSNGPPNLCNRIKNAYLRIVCRNSGNIQFVPSTQHGFVKEQDPFVLLAKAADIPQEFGSEFRQGCCLECFGCGSNFSVANS